MEAGKHSIILRNVSKTFRFREKEPRSIQELVTGFYKIKPRRVIKALSNINIEIGRGEFFGVIGKNGSGKSTLLHIMSGLMPPDKGGIAEINGKMIRMSLGLGFNHELSALENVLVNASILGLPLASIREKEEEIFGFAGLHEYKHTKIKYFSRGMKSRLAFAIAVHARADIFLMDEFFGGVGDETYRLKSEAIFRSAFVDQRTIVHVTHKFSTLEEYANRVALIHHGECIALGKPAEVIREYQALLQKDNW
jgi:ABC-2 type transport system ATP-binding protein